MKIKSLIIFVLIAPFLLQSCLHEILPDNTSVEGRVINLATKEPVAGVDVIVRGTSPAYNEVSAKTDQALRMRTDKNGRFSGRFRARSLFDYACLVDQKSTPFEIFDISRERIKDIVDKKDNELELGIVYLGYIKLNILNVSCNPDVCLLLKRRNQVTGSEFTRDYKLASCESFLKGDFNEFPQGMHYYTWQLLEGTQVVEEHQDSFLLTPRERKLYEINY